VQNSKLAAFRISPEEVVSYKSLNKQTYKIIIDYKSIRKNILVEKGRKS
jgi:hypothetical protein